MAIPSNISKEHLLKAIEKIDEEGVPQGAHSSTYDVVHNGKTYPPKLVISYANLFANNEPLDRSQFLGGRDEPSFKFLAQYGFKIAEKNGDRVKIKEDSFYPDLLKFLEQSKTDNLKTKHYMNTYLGLKVKVSFGQGFPARIPWISFLMHPHTTSEGIYPVYLHYKDAHKLILAYGISETRTPTINWALSNKNTVKQFFSENHLDKPQRYGDSFVFKAYDTLDLPNKTEIERDLQEIVEIYKATSFQKEIKQNDLFAHDRTEKHHNYTLDAAKTEYLPFNKSAFLEDANGAGLLFSEKLLDRFVSSLCTKPFVILTGLSGSGKTKLAQAFSSWICQNEDQFCIVPVGADWTNREPLLGYSNAIDQEEYVKPENGILDLLIAAKGDSEKPYFIILDEMNLSHVERYFADFLSIMETGEDITLYEDDQQKKGAPSKISWPKNVFIVGTVNIDETTYMFSPKVLDRANTIEFRITAEEMEAFLKSNSKPDLSVVEGKGANMAADFLRISSNSVYEKPNNSVNEILLSFFQELRKTGAEFGYRSASEIHHLLYNLSVVNESLNEAEKLDIAIMQKLLPKLHGSRRKLVPVLTTLGKLCLNSPNDKIEKEVFQKSDFSFEDNGEVKYPLSLEKLSRMYNAVIENGFASYAEA